MKKLVAAAVCRNGEVITGRRHCDCIRLAAGKHDWDIPIRQDEQGFIDEDGKYYSRKDALQVALDMGQVTREQLRANTLFSEDLW